MRFMNIRDEETNKIIYTTSPYHLYCISATRPLRNNLRGWHLLLCAMQHSGFDGLSQLGSTSLTRISQSNNIWILPFSINAPIDPVRRACIPSSIISMTDEDEVTGEHTLRHCNLVDLGAVNLSPGEYTLRASNQRGMPSFEAANLELHPTYPVGHPLFYTHSLAYSWMNMTPRLNTQVAA